MPVLPSSPVAPSSGGLTVPLSLAFVDRRLRVLQVDARLAAQLGSPVADEVGRPLADVLPIWAPLLTPAVQQVLASAAPLLQLVLPVPGAASESRATTWVADLYPLQSLGGYVAGVDIVVHEAPGAGQVERPLPWSDLALALDTMPVGVVLLDGASLQVRWANATYQTFLEAPFTSGSLVGRQLREFIPRAEESGVVAIFRQAATTGTPYLNPEYRHEGFARGTTFWRWSLLPVDRPGASRDLLLVVSEITEQVMLRYEAETLAASLSQEQAQLTTLLEQLPVGLTIAEAPTGRLLRHNAEAERLLRHPLIPAEDTSGYAQYGSIHADGRPYAPEEHPLTRALHGEVVQAERLAYRRGDGTLTRLEVSAAPVRSAEGAIVLAVVMFQDVAERERAEVALRESEARFRAVQETSIDGFMLLESVRDETGKIVDFRWRYANVAAERLIGKPREWFAGRLLLQEMPGNRVEGLFDAYVRVVETGEPWASECEYRHEGLDVYIRLVAARAGDGFAVSFADLSERRRAEALLRESEVRFRYLADQVPVMIWMTDAAGACIYLSRSWYAFTGQTSEEGLGLGWMAAVHPDDRATTERTFFAANRRGEGFRLDYRLRRADGAYRWAIDSAAPRYGPDGEFLGFIGSVLDITERKQAEERLRRLQLVTERFAGAQTRDEVRRVILTEILQAVEARRVGLRLLTQDGLVLEEKVFGASLDDAQLQVYRGALVAMEHPAVDVARSGEALFLHDAEDLRRRYPGWAATVGEDSVQASAHLPLARGGETFGVLSLSFAEPHSWEEGERIFALALASRSAVAYERARLFEAERDARQRLEETTAQLEAVLEYAPVGIIVARAPSGELIRGNRQTAAIWRHEFLAASTIDEYARYVGYAADGHLLAPEEWPLAYTLRTGRVVEGEEIGIRRGDGTLGTVLVSSAPVRGAGGAIVAAVVAFSDITERKQAESEREQLLQREQLLRAQAEEASRLKDEFLATVSHELRTPLTAFLGYAQLLQRGKREEAYVARTIEKMVQSAKAQAQIIEDLLDVSRIVSGKLRLEPQPLNLVPVVQAALDTVRPAVEAKGLRLRVALDLEAGSIVGDPNRLQQVVWNLLANATKFTPSGGTIEVRLEPRDHEVELSVSDTGQGISPEFLPFVFDRFRQYDSSSFRPHGGLGLGLAIVRHLVELHGGAVSVASPGLGEGAVFTVRLPVNSPKHEATAATALDGVGSAGVGGATRLDGLRVIVVDDQPAIRELLTELLALSGATVRSCATAREALELLQRWRPDVLVSDISMPGEDGYWLIERMRSLAPEEGGATPALALTAYVRMEDRLRVLEVGFDQYVAKPVEAAELLDVVARLAQPGSAT